MCTLVFQAPLSSCYVKAGNPLEQHDGCAGKKNKSAISSMCTFCMKSDLFASWSHVLDVLWHFFAKFESAFVMLLRLCSGDGGTSVGKCTWSVNVAWKTYPNEVAPTAKIIRRVMFV